jgi:lipase ATG15
VPAKSEPYVIPRPEEMLPRTLFVQIIALLYGLEQLHAQQTVLQSQQGSNFRLRHVHGLSNTSRTIFQDVPEYISSSQLQPSPIHSRALRAYKRSSLDSGRGNLSSFGEWKVEPITAPDISDPDTVLELAKMTNNAYVKEDDKDWYDLEGDWSVSTYSVHYLCMRLNPTVISMSLSDLNQTRMALEATSS